MQNIKLLQHQFEGPLDLLLSLIEDQKLDITQIALAQVTEQFLAYIKELKELDATILADYLSIAAKLLVIKSKAILPTLEMEPEEEEIGADLTEKLLLFKQFKEVANHLKKLDGNLNQSFTRNLIFSERVTFLPDPEVTKNVLKTSILQIIQGLKELDNLPQAKIKEAISIQEKIDSLQALITSKIQTTLSTLLADAKNRSEVIVTFLALLELTKQKILTVEQETLFTDITIKKYEKSIPDEDSHDTIEKTEE